eukprot:5456699-Pyramimonas_sp.AAC.1
MTCNRLLGFFNPPARLPDIVLLGVRRGGKRIVRGRSVGIPVRAGLRPINARRLGWRWGQSGELYCDSATVGYQPQAP